MGLNIYIYYNKKIYPFAFSDFINKNKKILKGSNIIYKDSELFKNNNLIIYSYIDKHKEYAKHYEIKDNKDLALHFLKYCKQRIKETKNCFCDYNYSNNTCLLCKTLIPNDLKLIEKLIKVSDDLENKDLKKLCNLKKINMKQFLF